MARLPVDRPAAIVPLLLVIACTVSAPRPARAHVTGLPNERVFEPLTADPTEVRLGFDWIEAGQLAPYTGRRIGLARFGEGPRAIVLSADGMLWARISSAPHFTFPLETVDGAFGVTFDRARGAWSNRLRWGHHSGHFGDGARDIAQRAFVYSRELVSFVTSYAPSPRLRVYSGPLVTVRSDPRTAAFQWMLGGEVRAARASRAGAQAAERSFTGGPDGGRRQRFVPYAAWHLGLKAENSNRVNQSYELGVRLPAASGQSARFMVGYFDGVSERGQLWHTPERYVRLGVAVGD